jgi:hypothetical protein
MKWEYAVAISITREEGETVVKALDSYIRRKIRDYNHDERTANIAGVYGRGELELAIRESLQRKQARIEAAKELRERINSKIEKEQQ